MIAYLLAMVATARYALLRPGRVDGLRPLSLRSTGVSPAAQRAEALVTTSLR